MSGFEVYLWLHLIPALGIVGIAGVTVSCVALFASLVLEDMEDWEPPKHWYSRFIVLGILCLLVALIAPSRKTVVLCHIIPAIANSEIMQELPNDLHEIYGAGMDELRELVGDE